jgi:hypothetical protein
MKKPVLEGLVVVNLIVGFSIQGWGQQPVQTDMGKAEYQNSCAACHGVDGKGAGPVAGALKPRPADLTTIAKKNGGVFPVGRIYDIIDGRLEVRSHGARDMPIWGQRFSPPPVPAAPEVNRVVPYFIDPIYDREPVIRTRILSVIDYLYRIQEK